MITVKFSCGGCDAVADGTTFLRRVFDSITGKSYGFGSYREQDVTEVAPDGWVAFDPYTGACYCPECWADIDRPIQGDESAFIRELRK